MSPPYDIDGLIEGVVTLPSLPGTVAEIMRRVNEPNCALSTIAKVISADPPLALKTLRLVNTAYYGLPEKVSTIEHAVALLGLKVIKNLVFTATVLDMMQGQMEAFFRHSVACAVAMQTFVEAAGRDCPVTSADEAFVYGLLHDIGKVLLVQFLPDECVQVAQVSAGRCIPWYAAEREVIGVDHAELGARLAHKWQLPDHFIHGIAGHHDLSRCEVDSLRPVAALVTAADYLCCQSGIAAQTLCVLDVPDETWDAAGLASAALPGLMDVFFERLSSADELIRGPQIQGPSATR